MKKVSSDNVVMPNHILRQSTTKRPSNWKRSAGMLLRRTYSWLGSALPDAVYNQLAVCIQYMTLSRWMQANSFTFKKTFSEREQVFEAVACRIADKNVLYLEFGVFKGDVTRWWSSALSNANTQLHGFDSFEGLPSEWNGYSKGFFDMGGAIPHIDDTRVRFWRGWFNETLPNFKAGPHEVLVLIMDADLYDSTSYALQQIQPLIKPGTFIYFDDLHTVEHDARAFGELMKRTGLSFRPVAAVHSLRRAFFECV